METTNKIDQVGGNHYGKPIQPWDIIAEYKMNWFQGEVLKYMTRFRYKGGKQDLLKAISIAQKAHRENVKGCLKNTFTNIPFILQYIPEYTNKEPGDLLSNLYKIMDLLINGHYSSLITYIRYLIDQIYGKEETSTAN